MEAGSRQLQQGLNLGAAKLRAAFWLEEPHWHTDDGIGQRNRRRGRVKFKAGMGSPTVRT